MFVVLLGYMAGISVEDGEDMSRRAELRLNNTVLLSGGRMRDISFLDVRTVAQSSTRRLLASARDSTRNGSYRHHP